MHSSILIVDDNLDFLELFQSVLKQKGHQVHIANCGRDGGTVLASIPCPDLILLDMELPDMTGVQFLDHVESVRPEILSQSTIVYCTAGTRPPDDRGVEYLSKMEDLDSSLARIESLLAIRRSKNIAQKVAQSLASNSI